MRNRPFQRFYRTSSRFFLSTFVLWVGLGLIPLTAAQGENESEIRGTKNGFVHLTPKQQAILGVSLVRVRHRPMEQALNLNGFVTWLPDRESDVTLRISGQVTAVYVNLGDHVHKGQPMVKVESRLIGNPPPSVVITAPQSGIVDTRIVGLGQAVEPNTILFHIGNPVEMLVVAQVYEEDLGQAHPGQKAEVQVLAYPHQIFPGHVTLVGPKLNPKNHTTPVWVQVSNPKGLLTPNMFARIKLVLRQNKNALVVPDVAILNADGKKFIFVQDGAGTYRRVDVQTGASMEGNTEILSGLSPRDEVVTQGNREIFTMWLGDNALKAEE